MAAPSFSALTRSQEEEKWQMQGQAWAREKENKRKRESAALTAASKRRATFTKKIDGLRLEQGMPEVNHVNRFQELVTEVERHKMLLTATMDDNKRLGAAMGELNKEYQQAQATIVRYTTELTRVTGKFEKATQAVQQELRRLQAVRQELRSGLPYEGPGKGYTARR